MLQYKALHRSGYFPATSQRQNRIPRRQHCTILECPRFAVMGLPSRNAVVLPAIARQLNLPKCYILVASDNVLWHCARHNMQFPPLETGVFNTAFRLRASHITRAASQQLYPCLLKTSLPSLLAPCMDLASTVHTNTPTKTLSF